MNQDVFIGIMIPFIGTSLGAALVFCMRKTLSSGVQRALNGFAAGVMTAASVWSLILPAIEMSEELGRLSFIPAVIGFWGGTLFLMLLDHAVIRLHRCADTQAYGTGRRRTTMMILAVTLHNIPEGMAVGIMYAGYLSDPVRVPLGGALALAIGIAIQNLPEGAIISMPLYAHGKSKPRAFLDGTLSGAVEPLGALLTVMAAPLLTPAMPYLLSFAAGAMIYVVVDEMIPEMNADGRSKTGALMFTLGFCIMMALDVALG